MSFHFVPVMSEIANMSGDLEPDIFNTTLAGKFLGTSDSGLYSSIKSFDSKKNYGAASRCADYKIDLTEFGKNINFLSGNSGTYGSLVYGMVIDYITHPDTKHFSDDSSILSHNVYDEYRYSNILTNQNCDVDIFGDKSIRVDQWEFYNNKKKVDLIKNLIPDKTTPHLEIDSLQVNYISYGGLPFSKIFNNIRNIEINVKYGPGNKIDKLGMFAILTKKVDVNVSLSGLITTDIYDPSTNTTVFATASTADKPTTLKLPLLGSTPNGRLANILLNTGGYTSHSKKIKYWDSFGKKTPELLLINRNTLGITDQKYGPCSAYCLQKFGTEAQKNLCDISLSNEMYLFDNYSIVGIGQTVYIQVVDDDSKHQYQTIPISVIIPGYNNDDITWGNITVDKNWTPSGLNTPKFTTEKTNVLYNTIKFTRPNGKWTAKKNNNGKYPVPTPNSNFFTFTASCNKKQSEKISVFIIFIYNIISDISTDLGYYSYTTNSVITNHGAPPWTNTLSAPFIPSHEDVLSYPIYLTVSNPKNNSGNTNLLEISPTDTTMGKFAPTKGSFTNDNYIMVKYTPHPGYNNNFTFNYKITPPDSVNASTGTLNLSYNPPSLNRVLYLTQDIADVGTNTEKAMCEGGIIDNAMAITNLANSSQSKYNIINYSDGKQEWVNAENSMGTVDLPTLKKNINDGGDTVYPVYYPHTLYKSTTQTYPKPNNNNPIVQYQIVSDFERTGELSCAEWGILTAKGGVGNSNNLSKLTVPPAESQMGKLYPGLNFTKTGDTILPSDYYKIVSDIDDGSNKCLQLKVSPADTGTGLFNVYGNATANGILCSSMFYGSCEITVRAKFPPVTGGIFGIWTFRSDVEAPSQSGGSYKFNEADTNPNDPGYISPANPCMLSTIPDDHTKDPSRSLRSVRGHSDSESSSPDGCYTNQVSVGYNNSKSFKFLLNSKIQVDFSDKYYKYELNKPQYQKKYDLDSFFYNNTKPKKNVDLTNGFMQLSVNSNYGNVCNKVGTSEECSYPSSAYFVNIPNYDVNDTKNKITIKNIAPNYSYVYTENDGSFFGGVASRNDEIDIEIPSNSPGNSWSRDYWSINIPEYWIDPLDSKKKYKYYCAWPSTTESCSGSEFGSEFTSQIHMGMWHRINNNSYTYTNNQGSGSVPYVNMWADAYCTGVTGKNMSSDFSGYTTGGALINAADSTGTTGYNINETCPVKNIPNTILPNVQCSNNPTLTNQNKNNWNGLTPNKYIEILAVDASSTNNMNKPSTGVKTKYQVSSSAKNITRVQLHYNELYKDSVLPSDIRKDIVSIPVTTDYLDEKYHDYTITWCTGKPPKDKNPNDPDYWNMDKWIVKPTATFYIDGKFQTKTSAFIPRRYSRINIGFIDPTTEFNYKWHGPFASNVKYAHTYIKRITITPFVTENEKLNQSDYWWPAWKDSTNSLRNNTFFNFYQPLGPIANNSYKPSTWANAVGGANENYGYSLLCPPSKDTSNTEVKLTKNCLYDPAKVFPYWGDINNDNIKPIKAETANSNKILLCRNGKAPTDKENQNCRIVFMDLDPNGQNPI